MNLSRFHSVTTTHWKYLVLRDAMGHVALDVLRTPPGSEASLSSPSATVQSLPVTPSWGRNCQEMIMCLWLLFLAFTFWKLNDIGDEPKMLQKGSGHKTCFLKK